MLSDADTSRGRSDGVFGQLEYPIPPLHRSTGHDREAAELVAKLIREALELSSEP